MWGVIASIIISTLVGVGLNETQYHMSRSATEAINSAAKAIAKRISEDNSLYERFMNASTELRSSLASQIAQTMGYGARFEGLRSQINKLNDQQDKAASNHAKTQAALSNRANKNENLRMDTGSFGGAQMSEALANDNRMGAEQTKIGSGYDQNIIGGLQTGSVKSQTQGENTNVQK